MKLLWICLGGAVGSGARYLLAGWVQTALGGAFPWGTFAVNALGSFLLGALVQLGTSSESISPTLRLALGVGVLGGFTTYSTFNQETLRYFQEGAWGLAVLYVVVTVVICLAAGALGVSAVRIAVGG